MTEVNRRTFVMTSAGALAAGSLAGRVPSEMDLVHGRECRRVLVVRRQHFLVIRKSSGWRIVLAKILAPLFVQITRRV